jgi:uncharacterized membrane-anchored protein
VTEHINDEYITRAPYKDTGNIKDKSTKLIQTALYNQFIDENNKKIDSLKSSIKELEDNNRIQRERIEFIQREEEWSHNKSEVLRNDPELMDKLTKFDTNIHNPHSLFKIR